MSGWRPGTGPGRVLTDDVVLVDRRVLESVRAALTEWPGRCQLHWKESCDTCGEVDCFRMARLYEMDMALKGTSELALHRLMEAEEAE